MNKLIRDKLINDKNILILQIIQKKEKKVVFIAYSFYRNRNIRHLLNIFYGLYPVVMESLIARLLAFYVFPIIAKKIFSVRNLYFYGVTADYFFVFVS